MRNLSIMLLDGGNDRVSAFFIFGQVEVINIFIGNPYGQGRGLGGVTIVPIV